MILGWIPNILSGNFTFFGGEFWFKLLYYFLKRRVRGEAHLIKLESPDYSKLTQQSGTEGCVSLLGALSLPKQVCRGEFWCEVKMQMFFDHVEYRVSNYEESFKFYYACLIPLGFKLVTNNEQKGIFGFGLSTDKSDDLLLTAGAATKPEMHICFCAKSTVEVDEFYRQALLAGGSCNGPPGLRHQGYYAAFVKDPDGHNIEAVFR